MASPSPQSRPLFTLPGLLLGSLLSLSLLIAALSTRDFLKRLDAPPAGTYLVIAGQDNSLFVKLAQRSIKGLHRAEGIRGQLEVPGDSTPRPLAVRSENSIEWEKRIKIPPVTSPAKLAELESNVVVLLRTSIPAEPKLYGRTVPATFTLSMAVPRLDPANPKIGQTITDTVEWTMQLLVQPPGHLRLYQRINRYALGTAAATLGLALLRHYLRNRRLRTA